MPTPTTVSACAAARFVPLPLPLRAAATNLVRLPDAVGMREAAALGCRVATAFRGVVHRGRIRKDEWLAVFGCGRWSLDSLLWPRLLARYQLASRSGEAPMR